MSTVTIPGLFKRKGIWTYRRVIMPRHLAPIIGRTEIVVSLRTRDLAEAIALAEVERKKVDALIAEAKKIAVGPDGRPNPEQAAQAWKRKALADLRERLQGRPVVTGAHRAERNSHDLDVESNQGQPEHSKRMGASVQQAHWRHRLWRSCCWRCARYSRHQGARARPEGEAAAGLRIEAGQHPQSPLRVEVSVQLERRTRNPWVVTLRRSNETPSLEHRG